MDRCTLHEHTSECTGRLTCTQLTRCLACGWVGPLRDCQHDFRPNLKLVPVDLCPDCGAEVGPLHS